MLFAILTILLVPAGPKSILALLIALAAQAPNPQPETKNSQAVETHINDIIKELSPDSELRRALLQGARGNGVHYSWMDDLRKQGVKQVDVWIDISFDHKGRPKKMSVNRTEYFTQYEGRAPIFDNTRVDAIRARGLEGELSTIALEKAKHGFWLDVPRPKPHPFIGGTHVEFLDDECLPSRWTPAYFAKRGDHP